MKGCEQRRIQHRSGAKVDRVQALVGWSHKGQKRSTSLVHSPPWWELAELKAMYQIVMYTTWGGTGTLFYPWISQMRGPGHRRKNIFIWVPQNFLISCVLTGGEPNHRNLTNLSTLSHSCLVEQLGVEAWLLAAPCRMQLRRHIIDYLFLNVPIFPSCTCMRETHMC